MRLTDLSIKNAQSAGEGRDHLRRRRAHRTTEPLAVSLALYWPDRRKHDIDNIKVLLDVLTGIVWEDDGQIVELHTTKAYDKAKARVEIEIKPVA